MWSGKSGYKLPKRLRLQILARDKVCQRCGSPNNLEVDHINNRQQYGIDNHPDNLQALCKQCHKAKTQAEAQKAKKPVPIRPLQEKHPAIKP